jgi:pterin-4a-carbinolamine dehydratase
MSIQDLADRHCKPCEGGVPRLSREQSELLLQGLHSDWSIGADGLAIARRFEFPAYSRTLGFANAVAWIAICEGHHPELTVNYGSCEVLFLVVDETCNEGDTLRLAVAAIVNAGASEVRTAVSIRTGPFQPDFHGIETEARIVLPWDREQIVDGELRLNPKYEGLEGL